MYCENAAVDFMCSNQSEFKNYDVVKKKTLHADSHRHIRDQLTGSSLL